MSAEEFQNRWEGCVVAPETGVYEFSVKTENGFRLFVNDPENALIDGWVSPGPQVREEKKSLYLVGGRAYRLILEHIKFKEAFGLGGALVEAALRDEGDSPSPLPAHGSAPGENDREHHLPCG